MKYILLLAVIVFTQTAHAQDNTLTPFEKLFNKKIKAGKTTLFPRFDALRQQRILPYQPAERMTAHGALIILPQDHMPCIVPDMKEFTMPNAGTKDMLSRGFGRIPNPEIITPQAGITEKNSK